MSKNTCVDRINTFDVAKGIGIILMVFGHTYRGYDLKNFIYVFHIPLFFIISGVFFNEKKYDSFKNFIVAKFNSLIIPYIVFYSLSFLYWLFVERYLRPGYNIDVFIPLQGLFLGTDIDKYMAPNGALWFLTCLFSAEILMYFIVKSIYNRTITILILFVSAFIGFLLSLIEFRLMPLSLASSFFALFFLGLGFIYKGFIKKILTSSVIILISIVIISLLIVFIISKLNGLVDMDYMKYQNPLLFIIGALIGTAGIISFSHLVKNNKLIIFLGKNSLIILGLSEPIKRAVIGLYSRFSHIQVDYLRNSIFHSIVIVFIVIIILMPIIYVFNNQLFVLIGRKVKKVESAVSNQ